MELDKCLKMFFLMKLVKRKKNIYLQIKKIRVPD